MSSAYSNFEMTPKEFTDAIEHIRDKSLDTLLMKNSRYGSSGDALHNFTCGAAFIGGTQGQAAWGYMSKHLVSLRDKLMCDDFSDVDDLEEKCQDIINYTAIIYAIGVNTNRKRAAARAAHVAHKKGDRNK